MSIIDMPVEPLSRKLHLSDNTIYAAFIAATCLLLVDRFAYTENSEHAMKEAVQKLAADTERQNDCHMGKLNDQRAPYSARDLFGFTYNGTVIAGLDTITATVDPTTRETTQVLYALNATDARPGVGGIFGLFRLNGKSFSTAYVGRPVCNPAYSVNRNVNYVARF